MTTQENAFNQPVIVVERPLSLASDTSLKGVLWLTTTNPMMPKFGKEQRIYFVGGTGTILYCRFESNTWIYAVEMDLGSEEIGRIGCETTVLLHEVDIQGVITCATSSLG